MRKDKKADNVISTANSRQKRLLAVLAAAVILICACFCITPLFAPAPAEEIIWTNQSLTEHDFDLIVVGGEPEGIAAALAAARRGTRTLLIVKESSLGGLMTLGKLNFIDMCYGGDGTLLTRGIFEDFYDAVGGSAFDITEAKNYFLRQIIAEPLITLRTNALLTDVVMNGSALSGIKVSEAGTLITYTARRFIDATADGDLAAMSGVPYTYGGEDIGEKDRLMGVTLVFELSGVSWTQVFLHLNGQRLADKLSGNPRSVGATLKTAWGYEEEGFSYIPNDPLMRLRGFNAARQKNGNVLINALLIFGVEPLDEQSRLQAIARAEAELVYLIPYINENFSGFGKARLASCAEQLYVRETRHIIGEYQLTIDDVLENRDQPDKIAIGSYPADVQPSAERPWGTVIGNPDRYAVPFRSLVPLAVDNLLVVGRSASFTSLAASSARVIPLGMACGEAAGAAAAQSVKENISFRDMCADNAAIARLQAELKEGGAYLEDFSISEPVMSHWAYDSLATLRRLGLADGGYQNDYRLDVPIDKWRFQNLLNALNRKLGINSADIEISDNANYGEILAAVAKALRAAIAAPSKTDTEILSLVMPTELAERFSDSSWTPNAAEVMVLLANYYNYLAAR